MAFKIAEAFVEIKGDKGKFSKSIRGAKRDTKDFATNATRSLKRVTTGLKALAVAAGVTATIAIGIKLTNAIIRLGKSAFDAAVQYDKLRLGLKAVAGSSRIAERQLVRLREVAKLPGLSFREAIAGSTALQAAGLSARLAERSLTAFGNALVTVGKGAAELRGVNLALTQIVTKQTGFGQELRQLSERLPQVRKAMKDAFGASTVEDFQKLGLTAEEFIEGLVTEFEKLEKVSGTVANTVENLGISFDILKAAIGNLFIGQVETALKGITDVIEEITKIIPVYTEIKETATQAFVDIAIIGVKTTAAMLEGMSNIVKIVAKVIWIPIKAGLKIAILEALAEIPELLTPVQIFKGFGKISDNLPEGVKNFQKEIDKINPGPGFKEITNFFSNIKERLDTLVDEQQAKIWAKDSVAAVDEINAALPMVIDELQKIVDEFTTGTGVITDRLKLVTDGIKDTTQAISDMGEELGPATQKLADIVAKPAELLKQLRETMAGGKEGKGLGFFPSVIDPLGRGGREEEAASRDADFFEMIDEEQGPRQTKMLGDFRAFLRKREEATKEGLRKAFEARVQFGSRETASELGRIRKVADEELTTQEDVDRAIAEGREKTNALRIRKAKEALDKITRLERMRVNVLGDIWIDFTSTMQSGFANMFADMLTGAETSWKKFAVNLKDIFLKELAKITVSLAFRGLQNLIDNLRFGGIENVGGRGTTSNRNPFAGIDFGGTSADPDAAPGVSLAPGRGPINVILPNADIEHMSTARVIRTVQRQFEPARRELMKRGIIPASM